MANTLRIIVAGLSLFVIGDFLYGSPELVETRFLSFRSMRAPRNGSAVLLTTIWAFISVETALIAFVLAQRTDLPSGSNRQFGILTMLVGVVILTIPLSITPIYESVVSAVPIHPRGSRGLPSWLFVTLAYTLLLPIWYLCVTLRTIIQE